MFKKVKDAYLTYHIRAMLNNYYFMLGIDMKELEKKSAEELVQMVEKLVKALDEQNKLLTKTIEQQGVVIGELQVKNKSLVERNTILTHRLSNTIQKQPVKPKAVGLEK